MEKPSEYPSQPALHLVRLPGTSGPIVRCAGELTGATVEAFRQELDRLVPAGHFTLTLDLTDCRFLDVDGILTLLQTYTQRREEGCRLVVVAGAGQMQRLLQALGIDWILPVFPSEEVAARALRGGGPLPPAPATWAAARAATLTRWRAIQKTLDQAPPEELLRQFTSMTALCERAEEVFQERSAAATTRCQFCPLFYALGGRPADVGCQSVLDPILEAVRTGNPDAARTLVAEVIRTIREMPLPDQGRPPAPGPPTKSERPR
jgi:anti-anti-sigma factor